jgi:hypothetical protein
MKLIIDIPEEEYNTLQSASYYSFDKYAAYLAMKNGTPLPKGHGRLIDADFRVSSDDRTIDSVCGYMAPTIIEADVAESEDKE